MTAAPAVVIFTRHAAQRATERDIPVGDVADVLLSRHGRRRRNPSDADWLLREQGIAIAYNWPDGDDATTAVVISVWRE